MSATPSVRDVVEETLGTFGRFCHAPMSYWVTPDLPPQSAIEFLNYIAHLIVARDKSGDDQAREIKRAHDHLTRALLDYYKFLIFFHHFDATDAQSFSKVAQIRILEYNNVGGGHNQTLDAYENFLEGQLTEPMRKEITRKKTEGFGNLTSINYLSCDVFASLFQALAKIEVTMQLLTLEKPSWIAGELLQMFGSHLDPTQRLRDLVHSAAADFSGQLLDRYRAEIMQSPTFVLTEAQFDDFLQRFKAGPSGASLELLHFLLKALDVDAQLPV